MSLFRINRYEVAAAIGLFGALMLFVNSTALHSELPMPRIYFEHFWPVSASHESLRIAQSIAAFFVAVVSIAVPWWLEHRSTRNRSHQ